MEQSYPGSRISLASALASAKKIKNDDPPACVNSKDTARKKNKSRKKGNEPGLGIKFDNHTAGNYFALIGGAYIAKK